MDKASSDFVTQLFKENNDLRAKVNTLTRELHNKTVLAENAEDEIRIMKLNSNNDDANSSSGLVSANSEQAKISSVKAEDTVPANIFASYSKELEEALLALDRKTVEVKQLKDEILVVKIIAEELRTTNEHLNTDISGLNQEIQTVNSLLVKTKKEAEDQTQKVVAPVIVDNSMAEYKAQADIKLQLQETYIETLKKQIISIAMESNKKINDQQAQLQGVEALIDGIKLEYDEFIKITKIETDSFKLNQSAEFESLRLSFEKHKIEQFEEKKQLMSEYQLILFNLQSEFDEYRTTVEYLMNMEVAKLQDELSTQSIRNQQEIMYIIQAKDKFYTDMMVSKDAKIMSLIEGSDLQQIVQKHELDVENLRKDHQREIERVKTDQESEQKNLISLLQRQNVSFESKCEKLQSHLKTMENKSRELMSTIESKNKMLIERDELKVKAEIEFSKYIEEFKKKIELISVEKEQLRHKVIRMNLNAKGDGANTVANMVKRLTRETTKLYTDFEALCSENEALKTQNEKLSKTQKDQDKLVQFLEKGITKRNAEYTTMTATFEEFLKGRLKQSKKKFEAPNLEPVIPPRILFDNKTILKAQIPSIGESQPPKIVKKHSTNQDQLDLDRGYSYLRKFKTLSRAFATGSFKYVSLHDEDSSLSSTRQNPLYLKLQAVESVREGKVYGEGKSDLDDLKKEARLPAVKSTPGGKLKKGDVLLYHGKDKKDGAPVAATRIEEMKVSGGHLKIGD